MTIEFPRFRIQTFIAVAPALAGGLALADSEFDASIRPLIEDYCLTCHGGDKVKGDVDFSEIMETDDFGAHFEIWETVADVLDFGDMTFGPQVIEVAIATGITGMAPDQGLAKIQATRHDDING